MKTFSFGSFFFHVKIVKKCFFVKISPTHTQERNEENRKLLIQQKVKLVKFQFFMNKKISKIYFKNCFKYFWIFQDFIERFQNPFSLCDFLMVWLAVTVCG